MNSSNIITTLQQARAEWEAHLAQRIAQNTLSNNVLDALLYHILWYEREMLVVFRDHSFIGSPHWLLPSTDERNAMIESERHPRPYTETLAEERALYAQLLAVATALTDADWHDASRYTDMPADWLPWQVFASNTWEHYQQHTENH